MDDVTRDLNRYQEEVIATMVEECGEFFRREMDSELAVLPEEQRLRCSKVLDRTMARWTIFVIKASLTVSSFLHDYRRQLKDSLGPLDS